MKIRSKTLMLSFEHDVTVGNAIEATLVHQAFVFKSEKTGKIEVELDFADVDNVKFMGIPIENGYDNYKKFKKTMLELGIDVDKLMDEKTAQLITDENMETLKQMYRDTTGDL
jgi:hypothetical protein